MKRLLGLAVTMVLATVALAADGPIKIKLGTLAPKDSSPHQSLKVMAEAWRRAPGGGAQLIIFTDGTQGGEADMVARMRIGQLQAALLTAVGLSAIDDSVTALQTMPLVYRSLDEVDYVREKLRPKLERKFAEKGFVVLFWADAGWVKFFSRKPAVFPDDLKKQKLFAWAGDSKAIEIMKAAGYQPIPLETADILPGLQTGLIDALPAPPFFALAGQFYGPAPNMLDMNWAPLAGACVISRKVWDKIPPDAQKVMLEAATKAGDDIRTQARKEMDESVAAMKKRGLQVHELTPEAEAAWRTVAEAAYPKIRGAIVPADMFDEVQRLLAEYRAKK
ncbi:MAG TPA: TRAP transporter substrate-binding protein DctP [Verrucomicrobiae bacterium]|nr:TRAP transporter substrate-binding protein DctP [Verrucomicrobiae bacterium]